VRSYPVIRSGSASPNALNAAGCDPKSLSAISAICPARTKFRMAVQDYDTLAKRRDKTSVFWRNRVCGFVMKVALV